MGVWRLHKVFAPFYAAELAELDHVQSTRTIYFAHLNHAPAKLVCGGAVDWAVSDVSFGSAIAAPAGATATPTKPNVTGAVDATYKYYVTAIDANGEESIASTPDDALNDMSLQGNYNTIDWTLVADAAFYAIYKGDNGAPGYIGTVQAPVVTFKDRNLQAILSDTPPLATNPFETDFPSKVTFHQQRLFFGRTTLRPNAVWGSQSALPENMDVSRPAKGDDAVAFAILAEKVNAVNGLVSLRKDLVVLGGDSLFAVNGGDGGAIVPSAIATERQSGRGASGLKAIVVDSIVFYQPSKATMVRALGYTFELDGYRSNNVSIFSPHLFRGHTILDWTYQEEPYSCIWIVRDDGILLCFTWEEEQQVWGFTRCETDGYVERVTTIFEDGGDRLYALIRRTVNGVERRFHERLALPHVDDITTACHLDCSVTQISETAVATIDGLWHLEGATVSAIGDGLVEHGLVVLGGRVTLSFTANIRTAGLRYEGLIETLPPVLNTESHNDRQAIGEVTIRALETRGIDVSTDQGATFEPLADHDGGQVWVLPVQPARDFKLPTQGNWNNAATLTIRQAEPLPAHIAGIFMEVDAEPRDGN